MQTIKIHDKEISVEGNDAFWKSVEEGKWEPETFEILKKYLDRDHSYLDIGAWIGPTLLYAGQIAKHCVAFEPDPIAHAALIQNLLLNKNKFNEMVVSERAVGNENGTMKIGAYISFGDSMTSFLWNKNHTHVPMISLPYVFRAYNLDDCNFIKIDVEGAETLILPGAVEWFKKNKPTLYLSLHPQFFDKKAEFYEKVNGVLSLYPKLLDTKGEPIQLKDLPKKGPCAIIATTI